VRNISAPAARRGRRLVPVASRSHVTGPAPGPRAYFSQVMGLGPVLYLRMNDRFSSFAPIGDSSSSNATGAVNGTVTKEQVGPLAGDATTSGLLFDGATGFLELGAPPPAPLLGVFQNHDFTIEAWIKPTASANFFFSCGLFNNPTQTDQFLHFGFGGGNLLKLGFFGDDLNGVLPVSTGAYHHVVATWSATTRLMATYVDGMLDSSRTSGGALVVPGNSDAQVARVAFATGNGPFWYNGIISELAVYPITLSPSQVNYHFLLGANPVPNPVPKITLEV